ncbi:hypothetical protein AGMMS50256_31510 [Betaproteobacteria bacterium]|nr:hypothetical protein AGMMS50256_31510 [Betaproteobacteria bacterium]
MARILSFNSGERFFALYGNTEDHIVTPGLRILKLEHWLNDYCKRQGFERVVYFSPRKKIYFCDEDSARLAQGLAQAKTPGTRAAGASFPQLQKFGIPKGTPRVRVGNQRATPNTAQSDSAASPEINWSLRGDDANSGERLDHYMRESSPRTVVIFSRPEDAGDMDDLRNWQDRLHTWKRLSVENHNICIFIYGAVLNTPQKQSRIPRVLRESFFKGEGSPPNPANCFFMGAARQDEVKSFLHARRLEGQIA